MTHLSAFRALVAAGAAAILSGVCDTAEILIHPEVDSSFSFEEGFQEWTPRGTDLDDPPVSWDVERTGEEAVVGDHSVRLRLENLNDMGKIWIERAFELTEDQAYDVEVAYQLGTSDWGDLNHWRLITGVHLDSPRSAEDLTFQGDTGNGAVEDVGVRWVEKSFDFQARTGEDGTLLVTIGVWGTFEVERRYFLDDVRVSFTRR